MGLFYPFTTENKASVKNKKSKSAYYKQKNRPFRITAERQAVSYRESSPALKATLASILPAYRSNSGCQTRRKRLWKSR